MKTLDEVIKALEVCTSDHGGCEGCPYDPDCTPDYKWDDAIHYLKEYRDYRNADKTVIGNDCVSEAKNNPPLTWDELQKMEGKPVWIEGPLLTEGPHWIILGAIHLYEGKNVGYGKTWQAYRKERN